MKPFRMQPGGQRKKKFLWHHDLDFGALLAAGSSEGPSVIQVRTQNITPETIGKIVTDSIQQFMDELVSGALISVTPRRLRARILPLR